MKKYVDWTAIEQEYITAETDNINVIANTYNVSVHTIRNRATKGQWLEKRRIHKEQLANRIREKALDDASGEYHKFNLLFRKAGGLLLKRAVDYIQTHEAISPTLINTLADAIRKAQQIMQTSYGKDIPAVELKIGHQQVINVLNEYRAKKELKK